MSDEPAGTTETTDDASTPPAAAAGPAEKRFRRTTLSTGFGDVPGKRCAVCGFEGFKWQTTCPQGHPLA